MIAKTYGIFDSVQEEYIQTFTAKNDADAKRTADLVVRQPNFDSVSYKDRSIHHLYDLDTAKGIITDNTIYQVFNFSTSIEAFKQEKIEKAVAEKIATDDFKQELKDLLISQLKGEIHNEQKDS